MLKKLLLFLVVFESCVSYKITNKQNNTARIWFNITRTQENIEFNNYFNRRIISNNIDESYAKVRNGDTITYIIRLLNSKKINLTKFFIIAHNYGDTMRENSTRATVIHVKSKNQFDTLYDGINKKVNKSMFKERNYIFYKKYYYLIKD